MMMHASKIFSNFKVKTFDTLKWEVWSVMRIWGSILAVFVIYRSNPQLNFPQYLGYTWLLSHFYLEVIENFFKIGLKFIAPQFLLELRWKYHNWNEKGTHLFRIWSNSISSIPLCFCQWRKAPPPFPRTVLRLILVPKYYLMFDFIPISFNT